jgi:Holliday junction resolvase RusA-like endonuclease
MPKRYMDYKREQESLLRESFVSQLGSDWVCRSCESCESWPAVEEVSCSSCGVPMEFLGRGPITVPVEIEMLFLFDRPKRLLRRKDPDGRILRTGREDLDNLVKTVNDCLEDGGVLKNDRQVWSLVARQYYCARDPCEEACVEVRVRYEG